MGFDRARTEELPLWLDDEVGQGFESVRGQAQDVELRNLKDAVLLGLLESTPDEGLDRLGAGFQLERYFGESHDRYRARLRKAWSTWAMAGTKGTDALPSATVEQLREFGVEDVLLKEDHDWEAFVGEWYSRYWVLLGPTMPWLPMQTPFRTEPGVTTQGSTATRAEVLAVKRIVLKFKSPHAYPVQIILRFEGSTVSGPGLLTTPFTTDEPCCRWPLGKVLGQTFFATPFSLGGWQL